MSVTGESSKNQDKTQNFSITGKEEYDNGNSISATGFLNELRTEYDFMKPNAPPYSNAGLSLDVETSAFSAALKGMHIPIHANILSASTNVHLVNTKDHKLTADAQTIFMIPKSDPTFATYGVGVDYTYKKKFGVNASVTNTPTFGQTDYSVGGKFNPTPTSALGVNFGATKIKNPYIKSTWQPGASIFIKKSF